MSKRIEDKGNRVNLNMVHLFDTMTDRDFKTIWEQGQLKNFCNALSLDIHVRAIENNEC
jgi:hypothetical protein